MEKAKDYFSSLKRSLSDYSDRHFGEHSQTVQTTLVVAGSGLVLSLSTYAVYKYVTKPRPPKSGKYPKSTLPEEAYEAVIVGGGPSGATAAYYASKGRK